MDAYENAKIYKERTKYFHDKRILRRNFEPGPFKVIEQSPSGAVTIVGTTGDPFVVNGQRLKYFNTLDSKEEVANLV
nr:uncharacterized protein LOC109167851 [Ipomoea batatas]GME09737.1 uncharacterized protein LOC109167851 [Ipomoea batatas]